METINFTNNVEFVKRARELLTEDYPISYDSEEDTCLYRMVDSEGQERRCVVGRLFYGHVSESHPFWDHRGCISDVADHDVMGWGPEDPVLEQFPWLDLQVAEGVQEMHDALAGILVSSHRWEDLLKMAEKADQD